MSSSMIDSSILSVTTPNALAMLAISVPIVQPGVVTLRVRASLDPDSKIFRKIILFDMVGGVLTMIGEADDFPPIFTPGAAGWTIADALLGGLLQVTVTAAAGVVFLIGWDISTLP